MIAAFTRIEETGTEINKFQLFIFVFDVEKNEILVVHYPNMREASEMKIGWESKETNLFEIVD